MNSRNCNWFFAALLVCAVLALAQMFTPLQAFAATTNVTPAAGQVVVIPFHISGQYTATTTGVVKFNMPFPCDVLGVGASARASGGTSPTLTVNVKSGGTSILSGAISITATEYAEGTVTTAALADEAVITVDLTIGGTNPTWNDITVLITVVRK